MILIKNVRIHSMSDDKKDGFDGSIILNDSKIHEIISGEYKDDFDGEVIDGEGFSLYPGFIDAHSHLGLDGSGIGYEGQDYNELNKYLTPELRGLDGLNPMDPSFRKALEGGVTCVGTGPGSANIIGGTFVAVKTYGKRIDKMVLKDPVAMKCAFGENPKRVYREKGISTRMSTAANFRDMLNKTVEYMEKLELAKDDSSKKPKYDSKCEALIPVIKKEIPLKAHAHQANDIFTALRIAKEFDLNITLEHVTEGHLIAEELASENVPLAVGPSLSHPVKFEMQHVSFETPGVLSKAGCDISIITDAPVIPQEYLPLCAGLAVKSGMDEYEALKAITINPAKHLGISDRVGSIETGKDADLVLTNGNPLALETEIKYVFIDGKMVYKK
ncbi:amidohydrolase [Lagierella sp.]|uniref:amidohydrolase n=1 Tax=Lagierella sp. TaxID=2849657 RepID=UPI0026395E8E|nr:amidohydrolase [Lagierella sp.]